MARPHAGGARGDRSPGGGGGPASGLLRPGGRGDAQPGLSVRRIAAVDDRETGGTLGGHGLAEADKEPSTGGVAAPARPDAVPSGGGDASNATEPQRGKTV